MNIVHNGGEDDEARCNIERGHYAGMQENRSGTGTPGGQYAGSRKGMRYCPGNSLQHTFPIHCVSITGPWKVSVVTTAAMPIQFPFGMVSPKVEE